MKPYLSVSAAFKSTANWRKKIVVNDKIVIIRADLFYY